MNKRLLNKAFAEVKQAAKMDYAVVNTDDYGDCNTCANAALADEFGEESTGIYAKHWLRGGNATVPYKYLDGLFIGHDITKEQAAVFIEVMSKYYNVLPEQYDPSKSFEISEK